MNQQYDEASKAAKTLAKHLMAKGSKIVLAESCTAGMTSAMLATIPGISSVLCGSSVTYREQTKKEWLAISSELLATSTAESEPVTVAMAQRVLNLTPEAELAAAITGHLGPGVEGDIDGRVFIAIVRRGAEAENRTAEFKLTTNTRSERQMEAAAILLAQINDVVVSNDA